MIIFMRSKISYNLYIIDINDIKVLFNTRYWGIIIQIYIIIYFIN